MYEPEHDDEQSQPCIQYENDWQNQSVECGIGIDAGAEERGKPRHREPHCTQPRLVQIVANGDQYRHEREEQGDEDAGNVDVLGAVGLVEGASLEWELDLPE